MRTKTQSRVEPAVAAGVNPAHPLARGLAGCWLLNEGAGSIVHDVTGYRHHGVFSGGPAWSVGPLGRAIEFDGVNDWISMGDCLDLGIDDISVLAIVKYSVANQPDEWSGYRYGVIAGKGCLDSAGKGYGLAVNTSNQVQWQVRNGSSAFSAFSDGALNDGLWHLAIGVCDRDDSTGVRLYIDGVRQGTTANATALHGIDVNGSRSFAIGSRQDEAGGTWYWDFAGSVGMVCVWKRVLAEAEIRTLQQNPFAMFVSRCSVAQLCPSAGGIVACAGSIEAVTSASATATVVRSLTGTANASASLSGTLSTFRTVSISGTVSACAGLQGTLSTVVTPTVPTSTSQADMDWRKEALLNGATHTAFQLGTVLTQGWFWVRRNGCTAVYRGPGLTRVDLSRILYVAEPNTREIVLPTHLPHEPGSAYCYLVRRFSSCGRQEKTISAAALLRIGPDGQQALGRPNRVVGLTARQTGTASVRLTWFYCPLDQEAMPGQFNIYRHDAAAGVDVGTLIGTVPYRGRRLYCFDATGLAAMQHTFAVRAASADGVEGMVSAGVICQNVSPSPETALILSAAAL